MEIPSCDILIRLYYDSKDNVFYDEDGFVVFNIFDYITPTDLYLFKNSIYDMFVSYDNGAVVVCEICTED